jgi:phosphoribosyl 1,2-cyclic phosphodiesterase
MKTTMTLQFWGVRGSIPTPGPATVCYGGNTACVSVDLGHGTLLVLDAIQEETRAWIRTQNPYMQCTVACEGLVVDI